MTNPGDAVGTNGGYGGRTSVNAFNDVLSAFSGRGIIKGWQCLPKGGMTVSLGGQDGVRDVAIAENDIGQFTTLDNISVQPIDVTLSDAPTLGSRIDVIVGYVTNPPDSNGKLIDNPDACGLIVVESSVTTAPTTPDEAAIREAITADGGSGVNAYYVVLATIAVGAGVNVITNTEITQGAKALIVGLTPDVDPAKFRANPKYMQVGVSDITISSPGTAGNEAHVDFETPFLNPPIVVATVHSGGATGVAITTTEEKVDSFRAVGRLVIAGTTIQTTFSWVAIDPTQPPFISVED